VEEFNSEKKIKETKKLKSTMKVKNKKKKKKTKHLLFSILNQLVYAVRHYCD